MIGQYGRTYPEFFTGQTGKAMATFPDIVRSLAHYLYAGPNAVKYGLYQKSIEIMAIEFARTPKQIRAAFEALAGLEYAFFDEVTGFVWIPQCTHYQLRPLPLKRSDHNVKAARKWYANLPRNPFLGEFFDRYDSLLWLSDANVWPGTEVSRREWVGEARIITPGSEAAATSRALVPRSDGPERRRHADVRVLEAEFEEWWKHYPKKNGKIAARQEWMKLRPTLETPLATMIAKLDEQKRSHDWTKERGQFIPDPERYLKRGRWLDELNGRGRAMARHNEGTISTLMEMAEEDGLFGEDVDAGRPSGVSRRIGARGDRDED